MTEPSGIIFDIKKFALHDGPGIRTTVFLKGCPMVCGWCHNPEGQRAEEERMRAPGYGTTAARPKTGVIGRRATVEEVLSEIESDRLFYDESGGGATFSGGEPLMQPAFLSSLLRECRSRAIHTVLDTTGYAPSETVERIMGMVGLFHYDLKVIDEAGHRRLTGVPVGPVLRNLAMISEASGAVVIRFPLIPEMTDSRTNLEAIVRTVQSLRNPVQRIDVLPFHHLHTEKYRRLGREDLMENVLPPEPEQIDAVAAFFRSRGFSVTVGG
ncbi:MAG: glycyl-radical enzyme activating protein [Desulfobacterales bacterium]